MKAGKTKSVSLADLVEKLPPPFPKSKQALKAFFRNNEEILYFESKEVRDVFFVDIISLNKFIDKNL